MDVLFVGGTGQISLSCVELAVRAGHRVSVFNRGRQHVPLPAGVESIVGDMADRTSYRTLGQRHFDAVCQFMVFTPEQMAEDIAIFTGHTDQYIFISSASCYDKRADYRVVEGKTPVSNPFWAYSQKKIACEEMLAASTGLPWTIVRPSHTVRTGLPTMVSEGDVIPRRMLAGKPIFVAGDGSSEWTVTRSEDLAVPFVGLFGKSAALGEDFHITSNRGYTWDQIYQTIAGALGVEANIVHVPTDTLVRYNPEWIGPLLGDKTWTALFDNSKVKRVAGDFTCSEVLEEVLAEPIRFVKERMLSPAPPEGDLDRLIDRITADQLALGA